MKYTKDADMNPEKQKILDEIEKDYEIIDLAFDKRVKKFYSSLLDQYAMKMMKKLIKDEDCEFCRCKNYLREKAEELLKQ